MRVPPWLLAISKTSWLPISCWIVTQNERGGNVRGYLIALTDPDVRFVFCNRLPHSSASLVDCGSVATQSRYVDMPTCCHMSPLRETQRAGMLMAYAKIMSQAVITLTLTYTKTQCEVGMIVNCPVSVRPCVLCPQNYNFFVWREVKRRWRRCGGGCISPFRALPQGEV